MLLCFFKDFFEMYLKLITFSNAIENRSSLAITSVGRIV